MKTEQQQDQRVYELDLLRSLTALCVITTHVLFFTAVLNHSELGTQAQHAVVTSFHFAREVFMFVTAFALVYYGKPFSFKRFWTKRGIGVLIPYCMWSAVYVWVQAPDQSLGQYVRLGTDGRRRCDRQCAPTAYTCGESSCRACA